MRESRTGSPACRRLGALALLVAAGALAGCGDDSDGDGSPSEISKSDYLERANAICAELGAQTEELADRRLGGRETAPGKKALAAYEREATALQRRALRELRALPAPPGDEQRLQELYAAMAAAIDSVGALPVRAPGAGSEATVARFRELAAGYGLSDCAGG